MISASPVVFNDARSIRAMFGRSTGWRSVWNFVTRLTNWKRSVSSWKRRCRRKTSSAASFAGYHSIAPYSATKAGVNGMVRALSLDLGKYGIRVNAICPTHGMSPNFFLGDGYPVIGKSYEQLHPWDAAASPIPLKLDRPPGLRDNANAALFLISDDSSYMSGVLLPTTDGGTLSKVAMDFADNWVEQTLAAVIPPGAPAGE